MRNSFRSFVGREIIEKEKTSLRMGRYKVRSIDLVMRGLYDMHTS